jgi:hypothetical protein
LFNVVVYSSPMHTHTHTHTHTQVILDPQTPKTRKVLEAHNKESMQFFVDYLRVYSETELWNTQAFEAQVHTLPVSGVDFSKNPLEVPTASLMAEFPTAEAVLRPDISVKSPFVGLSQRNREGGGG